MNFILSKIQWLRMRLNYQNLKKNRNLELRKLCSFVFSVRHQLIMVPAQKKVNFEFWDWVQNCDAEKHHTLFQEWSPSLLNCTTEIRQWCKKFYVLVLTWSTRIIAPLVWNTPGLWNLIKLLKTRRKVCWTKTSCDSAVICLSTEAENCSLTCIWVHMIVLSPIS